MIAVIQRVKKAKVIIDGSIHSEINEGLLTFLGVEKGDTEKKATELLERIVTFRIFNDDEGKMNRSLLDIKGYHLIVSQFTLAANVNKGKRPSFEAAEKPEIAKALYEKFVEESQKMRVPTKTGEFGAMMDIELVNDGPVTFYFN